MNLVTAALLTCGIVAGAMLPTVLWIDGATRLAVYRSPRLLPISATPVGGAQPVGEHRDSEVGDRHKLFAQRLLRPDAESTVRVLFT